MPQKRSSWDAGKYQLYLSIKCDLLYMFSLQTIFYFLYLQSFHNAFGVFCNWAVAEKQAAIGLFKQKLHTLNDGYQSTNDFKKERKDGAPVYSHKQNTLCKQGMIYNVWRSNTDKRVSIGKQKCIEEEVWCWNIVKEAVYTAGKYESIFPNLSQELIIYLLSKCFLSFQRALNTDFIKLFYRIYTLNYISKLFNIFNDSKYDKERPILWIPTRINISILEMDAEIYITNGYK